MIFKLYQTLILINFTCVNVYKYLDLHVNLIQNTTKKTKERYF